MVTLVLALTAVVVTVNRAETVPPAGTVTLGGTLAAGSLLARLSKRPPAGAGPLMVTLLAEVEAPPETVDGDSETTVIAGGRTVRVLVFVTPP